MRRENAGDDLTQYPGNGSVTGKTH